MIHCRSWRHRITRVLLSICMMIATYSSALSLLWRLVIVMAPILHRASSAHLYTSSRPRASPILLDVENRRPSFLRTALIWGAPFFQWPYLRGIFFVTVHVSPPEVTKCSEEVSHISCVNKGMELAYSLPWQVKEPHSRRSKSAAYVFSMQFELF